MTDKFEIPKARRATSKELGKTVRDLQGLGGELELDPTRGHVVEVEKRSWTFVMTKQAVAKWDRLGKEEFVVGVLAYHHSGLEAPYVQRELVAMPGPGTSVVLEMRDADDLPLWRGKGRVEAGALEFSMPITRPGATAKGVMAGRLAANGRLTLADSRLPKPSGKKRPDAAKQG